MTLQHRELDLDSISPQTAENIRNRARNIGEMIDSRADSDPTGIGWMYPDKDDTWRSASWSTFRTWTHTAAAGLLSIGADAGDVIGIAAATSVHWVLADFATNCIGGATCAIYPNTRTEDVVYMVADAGPRVIFAGTPEIKDRLIGMPEVREQLSHVVVLGGQPDGHGSQPAGSVTEQGVEVLTWADLMVAGRAYEVENPTAVRDHINATGPDTLATLIYTSGTTGLPKGAELTHDSWIYEATAWGSDDTLFDTDIHFVWLPLTHAFGKCMLLIDIYTGSVTALDGRLDQITANLAKLSPSVMCGVPRIFEKIRSAVLTQAEAGGIKSKIVSWALEVGEKSFEYRSTGRTMPPALRAQYALADKLVFSTVRETLGGNVRMFVSGSARLDPGLQRWFFNIGIPLLEGYGVTETSAVSTFNKPQELRFGSVGRAVPGTTIMTSDEDEILIRGGGVMLGYHNNPELTEQVTRDGWFHTGDIGRVDDDGFVYITDRMRDVLKTSNGKFVSPAAVEGALSQKKSISQAVVVGEGHKFVSALIAVDPEFAQAWAKQHSLGDLPVQELVQQPGLREAVQRDIDTVNASLSSWEQVKKFEFLPQEMSTDEGTATPTLKVRRGAVIEKFSPLVDRMYVGLEG